MLDGVTALAQPAGSVATATGEDAARPGALDAATERFVRLYRDLFPPVYGYIRFRVRDAYAAEDLTAQVFERALARLATVRDERRARA